MPASISLHGQSTLPDGRVLVSGGGIANCYIYTSSSNTWSEVASIPANISQHGQSTLLDGKVLVSGGMFSGGYLNTVYIYNPDSNTWTEAASFSTTIRVHGQSTLLNGNVLISGGSGGSITYSNASYLYTPNSAGLGAWDITASIPTGFRGHGHSTLLDGKVLVSGGTTNTVSSGVRDASYIYTPTGTGTWVDTRPLPTPIAWHKQSTLADGRVLVSGGARDYHTTVIDTCYIYTPTSTGLWVTAKIVPEVLDLHGQSTLADGRVLVSGGSSNNGTTALNTAYIYTPTGWVFTFSPAVVRHRKRSYFACQYSVPRSIHPA